MVPMRAEFGSEYRKNAAHDEEIKARPQLVLLDTGIAPVPRTSPRRRRSAHGWERGLLGLALVCAVLFMVCTCVASLWHTAVAAYAASQSRTAPVVAVRVGHGDTLWRYAARYGDPGSYMPERVDQIARENHLSPTSPLASGQTLHITVQNPVEIAKMNTASHSRMASVVLR